MRKLFGLSLAVVLTVFLAFGSALAANAKVSAQCGDVSFVEGGDPYTTIFTQDIRTPANWDLFIDVSLECGLTTDTTVISKLLAKAVADAEAIVKVRVLVDPKFDDDNNLLNLEAIAEPGEIIFARRHQTLIAEFAGDISGALSIVDGALVIDEDLIEPEMLQLILDTMAAHSFNFIVPDLPVGDHTVVVQAELTYIESTEGTELPAEAAAAADAYLGKGSVTIEEVRMIKGENVVLE